MHRRRGTLAGTLALVALVGVASAHRIQGSRFDAPIPLSLLFGGAGVAVAATAAWLGRGETTPSTRTRDVFVVPRAVAAALRYGARYTFFAAVLLAVGHGLVGPQAPLGNAATVFVWAVWLKGIGLLSMLFGSPWRVLSPWRTLYDGLRRVEGGEIAPFEYPSWLGHWPALVGFVVAVGIVENLTVVPRSPAATAVLVAGYAAVMVLGAVAFGEEWFRHGDALSVLYRLLGRVAPVAFVAADGGYRIALRPPWTGCTGRIADFGLVAFVVATVYTVSFDGFTNTPEYRTLLFGLRELLGSGPATSVLVYLLGLSVFVGAFAAVAVLMTRAAGEGGGWRGAALAFAPTVLPIAAAYEVAHNAPFVAERLGRLAALVWSLAVSPVEPFDLLGWLSVPAFWGTQVLLIVVGHVVAVVAAHVVARNRYRTLARAGRAHLPLVALMVGYTVLSLWIISRPIAT